VVSLTLRHVAATRYVLPLREGGSLPGLVEADDLGMYVVKFHGAGQGPKVLVAEVVVGELARALGMPVPEIVVVGIDPRLAPAEPDQEVQDLLRRSPGPNLGLDYLPGSLGFEPAVDRIDPELAAQILWLDGLTDNVDRTWRNPNLLTWHRRPWLIDHGAALYWHHSPDREPDPSGRFEQVRDHVLLPFASSIDAADTRLAPQLTPGLLEAVVAAVPAEWLDNANPQMYIDYLTRRLESPRHFAEEAERARG
jgi:hypothetical protein